MLAKSKDSRHRKNDSLRKSNRRQMTENRITSNIMSHNMTTQIIDHSLMQVSPKYQTQVNQSKYLLNEFYSGNILDSQTPLPLDYLLRTDLGQIAKQYEQR